MADKPLTADDKLPNDASNTEGTTSESPQAPTLNRRDLVAALPTAAAVAAVLGAESKAQAYYNMFFKKPGSAGGGWTGNSMWTFGRNYHWALGLGDTNSRSSPVQVGNVSAWVSVCGGPHQLMRRSDGTLWGFGENQSGELGLGDAVRRSSPTQIGSLSSWTQVSCGNSHSLALRSDGTLWSFGFNTNGQLGSGTTAHRSSPIQVGTLSTWSVTTAGLRTC